MSYPISVIIPVYNVAPWLPRCLDSLLAQTFSNFQLILVDDGSTDGCWEICDRYAARDSRISVIHKENGGLSSARNAGLESCTGEFISFVDSDDWVHPQFLELMYRAQQAGDYDLVICGHKKVREEISPSPAAPEFSLLELNLEGVYRHHRTKSYVWNKLYRRSLIGDHRFIQEKIAEDAAFNGIVLGSRPDFRGCFVPADLYFYFDRPGSLVHQLQAASRLRLAEIFQGYAAGTPNLRVRRLYIRECLKSTLFARYLYRIAGTKNADCRKLLCKCIFLLWGCPGSLKENLAFTVLCILPQAYRLWRLREDPTLRKWEAHQRALQKKS